MRSFQCRDVILKEPSDGTFCRFPVILDCASKTAFLVNNLSLEAQQVFYIEGEEPAEHSQLRVSADEVREKGISCHSVSFCGARRSAARLQVEDLCQRAVRMAGLREEEQDVQEVESLRCQSSLGWAKEHT